MLNKYLNQLQEGYLFSDKTISVNLKDFESGKKNKLLIIGILGSGKTSLGKYLQKKYKVKDFFSDEYGIEKALKSPKRMIIETAEIVSLYRDRPEFRHLILDDPMIIIGISAMKAGFRADKRDGTTPKDSKDKRDIYISIRDNLTYYQQRLNYLRKDVEKLKDADIQEYTIPKFKPVYH